MILFCVEIMLVTQMSIANDWQAKIESMAMLRCPSNALNRSNLNKKKSCTAKSPTRIVCNRNVCVSVWVCSHSLSSLRFVFSVYQLLRFNWRFSQNFQNIYLYLSYRKASRAEQSRWVTLWIIWTTERRWSGIQRWTLTMHQREIIDEPALFAPLVRPEARERQRVLIQTGPKTNSVEKINMLRKGTKVDRIRKQNWHE